MVERVCSLCMRPFFTAAMTIDYCDEGHAAALCSLCAPGVWHFMHTVRALILEVKPSE